MRPELREFADEVEVASAAADFVLEAGVSAAAATGSFALALSGGHTPEGMFAELDSRELPWEQTVIYQVDERIVPIGDPQRNLSQLRRGLPLSYPVIEVMPVDEKDLASAAQRYGALLPERLDLVHLGLGADGHTASLIPGDPVVDDLDDLVALTGPYEGYRRMTMTYRALARADVILWIVTGREKRDALARLLAGDPGIPAGRVEAARSVVMADRAAL